MSDSDSPRHRRQRSRDRDDRHRRHESPRDRKRHRSRSPSTDRRDRHKRRPRSSSSSSSEHHESSRNRHHDRHDRRRGEREEERVAKQDAGYPRRQRSRSRDINRERRPPPAPPSDRRNGSHRHDEDKQLTRTRSRRDSPRDGHHRRRRSPSRSPPRKDHSRYAASPQTQRAKGPLVSQQDAFSANRGVTKDGPAPVQEKQKPNYGVSGKLAAETNTVKIGGEAILLKYHEPPEARKPASSQAWRMYEFKGESADPLSTTELGSRSCWLFGRETAVVDFLIEHPSCSKQHAVVQFRYVEKRSEFGDKLGGVKPYVLDLDSANGTIVNGERIPGSRYMELKSGDSVAFGESSREYVVLLPPKEKTTK